MTFRTSGPTVTGDHRLLLRRWRIDWMLVVALSLSVAVSIGTVVCLYLLLGK